MLCQPNDDKKIKKFNFSVSYNPAIPFADFGSKSSSNTNAGFARPGPGVSFFLNKRVSKKIQLTGGVLLNSFILDENIINQVKINNPNYSFKSNVSNWNLTNLLIGLDYSFLERIINNSTMSFYNRMLFGFAYVKSPEIFTEGANIANGSKIYYKQSSDKANSFSFLYGVGVKYNSPKKTFIAFGIDFLYTYPQFSNVIATTTNSNNISINTTSFSQNILAFPISIIVGIKI